MVLLEAFGLASAELFQYNRENFQFDNEQRISRDVQKYKMQVERFELFREDIEDLVKLTVDKMDMYHLVSAVVLGFTTSVFTEGRIWAHSPPSYIAVYFMTIGCGWLYLLMTVWLSMYASISSHSLGVRLRTRYVRLPIPSMQQLYGISSKLQDFEQQGVQKMLRLPFGPQGTPQWQSPGPGVAAPAPGVAGSSRPFMRTGSEDLLGRGEAGFGQEKVLTSAASTAPAEHVQMFRKLQSKWQCFDAYARVSMSLGVYQIVQAINLFVLGLTLVETHCPSVALAVTLLLQAVALALNFLDLAGLHAWQWAVMLCISSGCSVITAISLIGAKLEPDGLPDVNHPFSLAPLAYWFQALYFQVLLVLACPSDEQSSLPRRFRAVLFLDVFGDASYDPTDAEHALIPKTVEEGDMSGAAERAEKATQLAKCWDLARMAQMALRRWEAVPDEHVRAEDAESLWQLRKQYTVWRKALLVSWGEMNEARGIPYSAEARDRVELRPWNQLSAVEKSEDVFTGTLVGPLYSAQGNQTFHYDLEKGECIFGRGKSLSLREVASRVTAFQRGVQSMLALSEVPAEDDHDGSATGSPRERGGEREGTRKSTRKSFSRSMTATFIGRTRLPRVDSLPWKVLQRLTQVLQCCWIFLGIVECLCNWFPETFGVDVFRSDWGTEEPKIEGDTFSHPDETTQHEGVGGESEEAATGEFTHEGSHEEGVHEAHEAAVNPEGGRRLRNSDFTPWWQRPQQVAASWPHGNFFRPELLACGGAKLFAATAFALYQSEGGLPLAWQALPRKDFPVAVPICGDAPDGDDGCLFAAARGGGVALWPWRSLDVTDAPLARPWHRLAGASVPCRRLAPLAPEFSELEERCLLLVGWDGQRLPVATLRLSGGAPSAAERLELRFDVPLERGDADVRAMHLDSSGQLWLLLGNELLSWQLLAGEFLGRWQPHWRDFTPRALCARQGRLLVAGSAGTGYGRPLLLALQPNASIAAA
ncbi:unnamed protein product [Effrenium voratum]|uniref:Uncharacterized protein n=1 Tax=Effrenium voratum TaxID=2562239 RepID=A0AA36MW77_9DINO|nr:unnamed protein product [Effrenium voratum]